MAYPKKDLVEAIKVKEAQLRAVVSKRHPTKLAPEITILYNLDSSRAYRTRVAHRGYEFILKI